MRRTFEKHSIWIVQCSNCDQRSTELEPTREHASKVYRDAYFEGGGAGYENYLLEGELLRARGRRYGELLKTFVPAGSLLDVGAAAGFVLSGFCEAGWQGVGLEPNAKMATFAQSLGVEVKPGVLEELPLDREFDAIAMLQVLPHFFEPRAALERAARATRPGGVWLVETWDCTSWTARLFGKRWHEYSPPSVLQWFSRRSLAKLARRYGFKALRSGRPPKWLTGGHARSLLMHTFQGSALSPVISLATRAIPETLTFPYPAEDVFWTVFQKETAPKGISRDSNEASREGHRRIRSNSVVGENRVRG